MITLNNGTGALIEANVSGQTLTIGSSSAIVNLGTLEATNGGTLTVANNVTNTGGLILADGGTVNLNSYTITNGTLQTANGGTMNVNGSSLAGTVTVAGGTTLSVAGGQNLYLQTGGTSMTLDNGGNVNIGAGGVLNFMGGGTVNLNGGTVTLNAANIYTTSNNGMTLNNNGVIAGSGDIGVGGYVFTLNNGASSLIEANVSGQTLTLGGVLSGTGGLVNTGTLEATNGGTLALTGVALSGTGTVLADTGSTVSISGSNVTGVTLQSNTTGHVDLTGGTELLGTVTIAAASQVNVVGGQTTTLYGGTSGMTLINNGNLTVGPTSAAALILTDGGGGQTVTLNGTGTITLANGSNIYALSNDGMHLANNSTIQGIGNIGTLGYAFAMVNGASGLVNANGAGTLTLGSNISSLTNNGTFEANPGGTLVVNPTAFTNFSSGTLTGGTYIVNGASGNTGTMQLSSLGSASIQTNAATIVLNGPTTNTIFENGSSVNALTNLQNNTGSLTLEGGYLFSTTGNLSNSGSLTIGALSTLTDGGTYNYTQTGGTTLDNGTLTARIYSQTGGTVTVNGALNGAQSVSVTGSTLQGTGTVTSPTSTIGSGGILLPGSAGTPGTLTFAGTGSLTLNSGSTLSEGINGAGAGQFGVVAMSGSGALTVNSGSVLNIAESAGVASGSTVIGVGQTMNIMTANSAVGGTGFTSITGNTTFDGGLEKWTVANVGDNVVLLANAVNPINATWNSTSNLNGNWTTNTSGNTNWSCDVPVLGGCVPNNNQPVAGTLYNAILNNSGATLTLASPNSVNVNTLTLTAGTLNIASGATLNLTNQAGGITDINASSALILGGSFTATGGTNGPSGLNSLTTIEGGLTLANGQVTSITPGNSVYYASTNALVLGGNGPVNIQQGSTLTVNGDLQDWFNQINLGNGVSDIGGNRLNVTGLLTIGFGNFNEGGLTLAGTSDQVTAGQINNIGGLGINLNGTSELVHATGTYGNSAFTYVEGTGNTVRVDGLLTNGGDIQLSGINATLIANGGVQNTGGINANNNGANIQVTGNFSNSGNQASLALSEPGTTSHISGTLTNSGNAGVSVTNNALLTVGGLITNSASVTVGAGSTLTGNSGYTQTGSSATTTVNGTLAGTVNITGGALYGTGMLTGTVSINGGAIVQPGGAGTSAPGTLAFGSSLNIGTGSAGTFSEIINSNSAYGVLNVGANALTLGSSSILDITLNYVPTIGDTLTIADFGSKTGTFGSIQNDTFNGGFWNVVYNANNIELVADANGATLVNATWSTGSGNWTTAAQWSCSPGPATCVPNNGTPANTNYAAALNSAGNTLTLGSAVTVNSVDVQAGTLALTTGGSLTVTGAATVEIGANISGTGTISGGGTGTLTNNGNIFADGGTLDLSGINVTNLSGGTLSGGLWQAGVLGTGTIKLASAITTNAAGIFLQNPGSSITYSGGDALANLTNNQGGLSLFNGATETITPNGGTFANTGVVNVAFGSSTNAGSALTVDGNFSNTAGATVGVNGLFATGTAINVTGNFLNNGPPTLGVYSVQLQNGGAMNVTGTFTNENGGLVIVQTGSSLNTGSFANQGAVLTQFTVDGAGSSATVTGTLTNSGLASGVFVSDGGLLTVTGGVNNSAAITVGSASDTGNNKLAVGGTFTNNGGTLTLAATGAGSALATVGSFANTGGSVQILSGGTVTVTGGGGYQQSNGGSVTTVIGTLNGGTGGVSITGGTLDGNGGTVNGGTTIGSGGTILPGTGTSIAGTLNFGSSSLMINGTLDEVINSATPGTGFGLLNGTGALTLGAGAVLDIYQAAGYNPTVGTTLTIATFGSTSGTFSPINIANDTFDGGLREWNVVDTGTSIELVVGAVPPGLVTATWNSSSTSNTWNGTAPGRSGRVQLRADNLALRGQQRHAHEYQLRRGAQQPGHDADPHFAEQRHGEHTDLDRRYLGHRLRGDLEPGEPAERSDRHQRELGSDHRRHLRDRRERRRVGDQPADHRGRNVDSGQRRDHERHTRRRDADSDGRDQHQRRQSGYYGRPGHQRRHAGPEVQRGHGNDNEPGQHGGNGNDRERGGVGCGQHGFLGEHQYGHDHHRRRAELLGQRRCEWSVDYGRRHDQSCGRDVDVGGGYVLQHGQRDHGPRHNYSRDRGNDAVRLDGQHHADRADHDQRRSERRRSDHHRERRYADGQWRGGHRQR